MRCERCGREISNTELWQIAADPKAPATWTMRVLCWDCREHPPTRPAAPEAAQAQATGASSTPPVRNAPEPATPESDAEPLEGELVHEAVTRATPPPA